MSSSTQQPDQNMPADQCLGIWQRHARWVLAVYWVCLATGTHWPNLLIAPPADEPSDLQKIMTIDKLLHPFAFGGLMVLLILAGLGGRDKPWARRCGVALAVGLSYALVDELTQGLVVGRSINIADFVLNFTAILAVYLIAIQPRAREPRPRPKRLLWGLAVSVPILIILTLSPWVIEQSIAVRRSIWGRTAGSPPALDHIAHGVLSLMLSIAVFVVWPMTSKRPRFATALALSVLIVSAPLIETAQFYTGRSVEEADMIAHWIGVFVAMTWWAARLAQAPQLLEPAAPTLAPDPQA